jgi:hypothetical protein
MAMIGEGFHETVNRDGTSDLLCLECRRLIGENASRLKLMNLRDGHHCRVGFMSAFRWKAGQLSLLMRERF